MELSLFLPLPHSNGEIVESYLKFLKLNVDYKAFTLNEKLEIIECKGIICSNKSWNYHNNYDNSENELFVKIGGQKIAQWFALSKDVALKIQDENIKKWKNHLMNEISRLNTI
jgi:hypothetical protein